MEKSEFLSILSRSYPDPKLASEDALTSFYELYWSRLPKFEGHFAEKYWILGDDAGCDYEGTRYTNRTKISSYDILISPDQCIGSSWLFDPSYAENKPYPQKMAQLTYAAAEKIRPFFVCKAGDYYYCTDGNHRIYAAYLFDRPLLVTVYEEFGTMTALAP